MTQVLKNTVSHLPALDGLRAAAVMLVILSHYGLGHIVPGGLGVTVFFFLSGFLITRLMFAERNTTGRIGVRNFYMRRLLRLYPALLFFLAGAGGLLTFMGQPPAVMHVLAGLFYYENYSHLFGFSDRHSPFHILWSLAVEEHFYLVFPMLFVWLARWPRLLLTAAAGLALLSLGLRLYGIYTGRVTEDYTYQASEMRMESILYGVMLATLVELERGRALIQRVLISHPAALVTGVALLALSLVFRDEFFRATVRYSIQGIALLPIFAVLAFGGAGVLGHGLRAVLSHRGMVALGKISYPLYLWHNTCHFLVTQAILPQAGGLVQGMVSAMAAGAVAMFSYWVIERPALRLKKKFTVHAKPVVAQVEQVVA
jgi:peptidoglycan/LPS O-acetylase OafA/YrhL